MVKNLITKLLRFLFIVVLACITFIIGFVVYTGIKEAIKGFVPAFSKLWNFITTNPVLVIIILSCLLIASLAYDKLMKAWKKRKDKKQK